MLRRFIAWIDSCGDRINPITVRDLRRLKCWWGLEGFTLFVLTGLVCLFVGMFYFAPLLSEFQDMDVRERARSLSQFLVFVYGYGMMGAAFTPLGWLLKSRKTDELFEAVPLTSAERIRGYFDSSCVLSVFSWGLFTPFLAVLQLAGPVSWSLFLIPFVLLPVGPAIFLYFFSFLLRSNRPWQHVVIFLGVLYFGAAPMILPMIGVVFLWADVFGWPELYWNHGFGFVSLFVLLPLALLVLGLTAYRLSVSHLERRRALWLVLLGNLVVYFVLCSVLALCYLGLAALVFYVF